MKKNIKNALFIISVFYSFVIIVLMCVTMNNLVTEVEVHDSEENKSKLINYKEQLSNLPQTNCTAVINKLILHYEGTSYDGVVNLSELYEYDEDKSLLSYYQKVKDGCNITEEMEKKYNLSMKFITSSLQWDELYQRYYFQYELKFTDYKTRLIVEPLLINLEYQINRTMELEIISSLIEIANGEVDINE